MRKIEIGEFTLCEIENSKSEPNIWIEWAAGEGISIVEMVKIAEKAYDIEYDKCSGKGMKAALEAVFNHIVDGSKKEEPEEKQTVKGCDQLGKKGFSKLHNLIYNKDFYYELAGIGAEFGLTGDAPQQFIDALSEAYDLNAIFAEEKKELQKQTLMEYVYGDLSNKSEGFKYQARVHGSLIQLISEYLEQKQLICGDEK